MALLKSTNVIGNLSATGNIIASKFMLNGGNNNSLLLAGGNTKSISDFATSGEMAAAVTSITNLSNGKVSKAGDTMSGPLTNTHVSATWINSCNGNSAYNVGYGSYTGWINGYTKDGRMAISTYPHSNNNLYFIYMKNDTITAGTNSTNAAMTWDGSTNTLTAATFTGALNGNAATATKWATARTLTIGATGKSIDGTANVTWTPYEMRVTRAQYNVGSNMNQIADHGCELGMASLTGTDTTINPGGGTDWHHYINMTWSDTSDNNSITTNEWCTQIANKVGTTDLWVRSRNGGSIANGTAWAAPWTRILTGSNWTSVVDGRYLKLTGGTMTGDINMSNNNITNVGNLTFNDPGNTEGITWTGGNGWWIYESPDNLINDKGNLQFVQNTTRRFTLKTNGIAEICGLLQITNNGNTVTIGSQNAAYTHIYNSTNIPFIFDKTVASVSGDLGTDGYPWLNIKFNGELQFFENTTQRAKFKYNTADKCIDVLF